MTGSEFKSQHKYKHGTIAFLIRNVEVVDFREQRTSCCGPARPFLHVDGVAHSELSVLDV